MGRPRVTVYNEISVDGRIEGFAGDGVAYYRHGFTWPCDAILMGSVTAQAFGPPETDDEVRGDGPTVPDQPVPPGFEHLVGDPRHLLAVVDSRGTVRGWRHARAQPWYDRFVALTSATTPAAHLDHLARRDVEVVRAGDDRVDLAAALGELHDRFGVRHVRTDGGGALTAALLAGGLVDDLVVMVAPRLAGVPTARGLVDLARPLPAPLDTHGVPLRLDDVERLDGDVLVLRYRVDGR